MRRRTGTGLSNVDNILANEVLLIRRGLEAGGTFSPNLN